MALTKEDIQKAYIAFFNRPADADGFNYWLNYTGDAEALLTEFAQSAEYLSDFAGLSNMAVVTKVYNNLFGRDPEPSGLTYWVGQMATGDVTIANVAHEILGGARNEDATIIANKVTVAQTFTDGLDTPAKADAYAKAGANGMGGEAKAWLSHIDESDESVAGANAELANLMQSLVDANTGTGPVTPDDGTTIWLGGSDPTISGTDGDDTFVAQTGQLQDNVILDGKAGNDTLEVTVRDDQAIAATTKNIEKVVIRGQASPDQTNTDNNIRDIATVDADRMVGVNWWESKNSRVDVKIEDVRILDNQITKDITIAFRESDPGHVDYAVYFDQPSLRNQTSVSGVLVVALYDSMGDATDNQPLKDNPYSKIMFKVNGASFEVDFGTVNGASTFENLRDAIQAAINANTALSPYNITVTLHEGATFWVPSDTAAARANAGYYLSIESAGNTIDKGGWATSTGYLPPDISTQARQDASNPITSSLVTSTVVLDYVGRGSMGGDLVIGGMSTGYTSQSKGVQQFDISVERDSKLEIISSTNNTLQVVNLVNNGTYNYLGAYERNSNQGARSGDLTVKGDSNVATVFGKPIGQLADPSAADADQNIDGVSILHQDSGYGFNDVRVVNGSAFRGNLDLNAFLSENVVGKYMNLKDQAPAVAAADNVVFQYSLGAGNDKLDLAISSANLHDAGTTTREDFVLNVDGGAGNDVITTAIIDDTSMDLDVAGTQFWYANHKDNANLLIDAGTGNDTINTRGSGDWTVKLGTGNDTYYADNSNLGATWVFNTANQADPDDPSVAQRVLDDLDSGLNSAYITVNDGTGSAGNNGRAAGEMSGLFGLKLRVVLNDVARSGDGTLTAAGQGTFISSVVDVPTTAPGSYRVTNLQINQAIKKAINDDPVLGKLLAATDGPSNTLVVTSLTDGARVNVADLGIEFAIPLALSANDGAAWRSALKMDAAWTDGEIQFGRVSAFNSLLDGTTGHTGIATAISGYDQFGPNAGDGYSAWYSANGGDRAYQSAYANDGSDNFAGANSVHRADNIVIVDGAGSDLDVVVLSTGADSVDTVKWDGTFNNGTVKVVNFDTTAAAPLGADWLDFSAYGARWLGVATKQIDPNHANVTTWLTSQDDVGLKGTAVAGVAGGLPTAATETYIGDFHVKNGDKYITMTREWVDSELEATNPHASTTYKIELWTVAGGGADAYTDALSGADTARDTAQLIGYVDLGRVIDGTTANDIVAHIDIF